MEQKCKTAKDGKSGRIDANAWSREAAKSAPVGALSIYRGPAWLPFWPTVFPPHAEDKILFRTGDIKTVKVEPEDFSFN